MKKLCTFVITLTFVSLAITPSLFAKKKDILIALEATDIIKGSSAFNHVQVVDARKEQGNIGHTYEKGKKRLIVTNDSLTANVQQMVQSMLLGADHTSDQQLLIVIHNLKLQGQLISTILIDADFYLGSSDQYIHAGSLDSLYEMHTRQYGLHILFSVTNYLFTEKVKEIAALKDQPATPRQSLRDILTEEDELKRSIAMYQQPARRGVYYTYEQFRNNTPADTFIYHEHYFAGDAHVDRFYLSSSEKKKNKSLLNVPCFAIYDDGKWYKPYTDNSFREMKLTDGDFLYYEISKGLKLEDQSSIGYAGAPFSMLAIQATPGLAQTLNDNQLRKLPQYDDALFLLKLDPETGSGKKLERMP